MIQFGTKAETLCKLRNKLKYANVLPEIHFEVREWIHDPDKYYQQCLDIWNDIQVIIRSSAINEDTQEESCAGKFESVANVMLRDRQMFDDAVRTVINSYIDDNENNQVLIQPMLMNVKLCGVAFTLDPNSHGNYYVINYDEYGSTSSITAGNGERYRLLYVFKGMEIKNGPNYVTKICTALKELEELFGQNNLDVEFAVDNGGYIFSKSDHCVFMVM